MSIHRAATLMLLVAAATTSCLSPKYDSQVPTTYEVPEAFPEGHGEASAGRWWRELDSAELNELVEEAIAENLDLLAMWARLRQAEAIGRQASSGWFPNVEAQASVGRSRSVGMMGTTESNQFQLSVAAAYELDIWGKTRAANDAAELDIQATRDNVEAMATTVAARVVEAWLDVVYQRARRKLLEQQLETAEVFLELSILRLNIGQATALDVLQQQQQLETLQSQFALLEAAEAIAQNKLSALVGRPPAQVVAAGTDELPELPPQPATGVPAELIENRPDVRAAKRSAQSADARVVIAMADRLPSVRLTGSLMLMAAEPQDLFDDLFWNVAASIAAPLFDGGRRAAEVDRTRAVLDERVFSYAAALLTAMEEVESALVLERQQRKFIEQLEQRMETAMAVLDAARQQYVRGATDYFRVLNALATTQQLEASILDARRQLLSYRIQLYRALGAKWTNELAAPTGGQDDS